MDNKEIIDYLKSLQTGQPFTIEQLLRDIGQSKGEKFSVFEVAKYEELEKQLIKEGLIVDTGKTTKIYNIDSKVNTL